MKFFKKNLQIKIEITKKIKKIRFKKKKERKKEKRK